MPWSEFNEGINLMQKKLYTENYKTVLKENWRLRLRWNGKTFCVHGLEVNFIEQSKLPSDL